MSVPLPIASLSSAKRPDLLQAVKELACCFFFRRAEPAPEVEISPGIIAPSPTEHGSDAGTLLSIEHSPLNGCGSMIFGGAESHVR